MGDPTVSARRGKYEYLEFDDVFNNSATNDNYISDDDLPDPVNEVDIPTPVVQLNVDDNDDFFDMKFKLLKM